MIAKLYIMKMNEIETVIVFFHFLYDTKVHFWQIKVFVANN